MAPQGGFARLSGARRQPDTAGRAEPWSLARAGRAAAVALLAVSGRGAAVAAAAAAAATDPCPRPPARPGAGSQHRWLPAASGVQQASWPPPDARLDDRLERLGLTPPGEDSPPPVARHRREMLALRVGRRDEPRLAHRRYQLVVARNQEDLSWLEGVPAAWRITVYNTGPDDLAKGEDARYETVRLPNTPHGKEGVIYIEHLARNYGRNLADYTVLTQGNPFEHNEHFLDLIWHPAILLPVQSMSLKFSEAVPPKYVRDIHSPDPWFFTETFSLVSLVPINFEDCCVKTVATLYRQAYNISETTNLVAHMFDSIGLRGWVSPDQELGRFAYGGMVGVSKAAIMQHPRSVYVRMGERIKEHVMVGYIMERMWLMLFGGAEYNDRDLEPSFTLSHQNSDPQVQA